MSSYCDDNICIIDGAAIQVRDVNVNYGGSQALADVGLDIPACAVTSIVGPSGCGKSSFLNCINRMTDLIAHCEVNGSIKLHDQEILDSAVDAVTLRRRIGMIFQQPNPFPLSIERNVAMPLRYHGEKDRHKIASQVQAALELVGLWDEVKDRLGQSALSLSGGQQQRLCIARAIALEPEVLLMDEPCSALDPMAAARIEDLISALRKRFTVVVVTHNLAQARRIADHTAVFWHESGCGRVVEAGPTESLFLAPQNAATQAYLAGDVG